MSMMAATANPEAVRRLVADAQRGDRLAADCLVREHDSWLRSVIYGIAGRADLVDDIAQQVWMQVWQRIDSLQDPRRLRPWLYAIARHVAIDVGGRERRRTDAAGPPLPDEPAAPAAGVGPLQRAIGRETHEAVLEAIRALPAAYREPLVLRHLEDWSYAEIADVLGLPLDTVETRLTRARRMLREALAGRLAD